MEVQAQANATVSFGSRLLNFLANIYANRPARYFKEDDEEK